MLERFSREARGAVSQAGEEAHRMGHGHIGTEHLLVGLLAETGTPAAGALTAAGASLVSVREKVVEALASRTTGSPGRDAASLGFSDRAARALDRAGRLALRSGRDEVSCEHVLVSVLDVEGTAGQVLRGLGVDPDVVRNALHAGQQPDHRPQADGADGSGVAPVIPAPRCGDCGTSLAESLGRAALRVASGGGADEVEVEVFYCTACGTALGVGRP